MRNLRVAGDIFDSLTNGPGLRYVLFLQGCTMHCDGCQNPHTWDLNGGVEMSIPDIIKRIEKSSLIDGITLSGGDPIEQLDGIIELCEAIKKYHSELNIIMYTGRTYDELLKLPNINKLFNNLDYIVDGKFQKNNMSGAKKYTGSANQDVWWKNNDNEFIRTDF